MELVDLTLPLFAGGPVFPGQPQMVIFPWHDLALHGHRTNALFLVDHTGTHVDLPAHFLEDGKTVEDVPLEQFTGKAVTLDVSSSPGVVGLAQFQALCTQEKVKIDANTIVLFYTGTDLLFGQKEYFEREVGITEEVARFLVEQNAKGVGIDAPSIDPHPFPAHRLLLSQGILIFEGLTNLKRLVGKKATFFGMALKLSRCSGSPIRAFAIMD